MTGIFSSGSPLVQLGGVEFAYAAREADLPRRLVLEDMNLEIRPGETVAFLGPNGSGKSSLLKLFCGVHHPSRGQYRYRGREISEKSLRDRHLAGAFRQDIGLVFQNPEVQLFCARVDEEVAFGPRSMGLDKAETENRVRDSLDMLGIAKLAAEAPFRLSGGEKRKVALAAVLALNPSCLVLDEPMNGLDPRSKRELAALLVRLKEAGKTLLCSTHDFAYVEGIFDRAVVIGENHRIVRDGPWQEILEDREFLQNHNIE